MHISHMRNLVSLELRDSPSLAFLRINTIVGHVTEMLKDDVPLSLDRLRLVFEYNADHAYGEHPWISDRVQADFRDLQKLLLSPRCMRSNLTTLTLVFRIPAKRNRVDLWVAEVGFYLENLRQRYNLQIQGGK